MRIFRSTAASFSQPTCQQQSKLQILTRNFIRPCINVFIARSKVIKLFLERLQNAPPVPYEQYDTKATMDSLNFSEFAQSESLSTRIANILQDYPFGCHSLYEFVQNADDAGATKFSLVLDFSHKTSSSSSSSDSHLRNQDQNLSEGYFTAAIAQRHRDTRGRVWVYNNSTFTEEDFQSIIRLGLSGKRDDASKVGRYGLGFNVAYHFTDVLTFLSRESMVMFDPTGAYLKDGMHGIRTDFVQEKLAQRYPAQLLPFQVVSEQFGLTLDAAFDGTLFELPLYPQQSRSVDTPLKPEEDLTEELMLSLLEEFEKSAPTLLLFLQCIEEISVYTTKDGALVPRAIISLKDLTREQRELRKVLHRRDDARAKDALRVIVEESKLGLPPSRAEWTLYPSKIEQPGVEHACIAARWEENKLVPVEGQAFSFLPLGVKTSMPVHINANFELSTNRRNVWTTQGDARWERNARLLEQVIPEIYMAFLQQATEKLEKPAYELWPCEAVAPFDLITNSLLAMICTKESTAPVFRYGTKKATFGNVLVEDDHFRRACGQRFDMRDALASCGRLPIALPERVRILLEKLNLEYQTTSIDAVLDILKPVKWSDALIDQVLRYCFITTGDKLEEAKDGEEVAKRHDKVFRRLHGLRMVPLYGGEHGVFRYPFNGAHKEHSFLVCEQQVQSTLSGCARLVDSVRVPSFAWIMESPVVKQTNLYPLSANSLIDAELMEYFIPKEWANKEIIFFSSKADTLAGCIADQKRALATASELANARSRLSGTKGPEEEQPKSKRKLKKERKQQAKARRGRKSNRSGQKEDTDNSVEVDAEQAVTAASFEPYLVESSVEQEVEEKLRLLWEIIDRSTDFQMRNLQRFAKFPIVRCDNYVMTVDAAVKRMVLPLHSFTDPAEVSLLRSFGLLFIQDSAGATCKRQREALVHSRSDAIRAVAETINRALTVEQQVVFSREQCLALRSLVLRYLENPDIQVPGKLTHICYCRFVCVVD